MRVEGLSCLYSHTNKIPKEAKPLGQSLLWVQQYWYWFLAMAVVAVFFIGYFIAYGRAQKPRNGTLEWIQQYDRPNFTLSSAKFAMTGGDIFPLFLACVLTFMSWGIQIGTVLFPSGLGVLNQTEAITLGVNYLLLPTLGIGVFYLLVKCLFGRSQIAFLCSMILGLDVTWQPAVLFFTVLTTYFTYCHITQDYHSSFWDMAGSFLLAESFFLAAFYFDPCILLYGVFLLISLLLGFGLRFRAGARTGTFGYGVKMLILGVIWAFFMICLLYIPAAVILGYPWPEFLWSLDFYQMIAQRLGIQLAQAVRPSYSLLTTSVFYDWVLFFGGTLAVVAMVIAGIRRRKAHGILIGIWYLGFFTMCILGGGMALPAICLLALAGVWTSLIEKGRWAMGYLCPLVVLVLVTAGVFYFTV